MKIKFVSVMVEDRQRALGLEKMADIPATSFVPRDIAADVARLEARRATARSRHRRR